MFINKISCTSKIHLKLFSQVNVFLRYLASIEIPFLKTAVMEISKSFTAKFRNMALQHPMYTQQYLTSQLNIWVY